MRWEHRCKRYTFTREYSKTDKRSFYVIPTDKARVLVADTESKLNEKLIHLEKKLGAKKIDELISILDEAKSYLKDC